MLKNARRGEMQKVIQDMLLAGGWSVTLEQIFPKFAREIVATKKTDLLGYMKLIIVIKNYKPTNPVKVRDISNLNLLILKAKATKGVIISTSKCTESVVAILKECEYKMSYKYFADIEQQIYGDGSNDDGNDLPF